MRIIITGTPGVGKTTLAVRLASTLNLTYIDLSKFIIDNIPTTYNVKKTTYEYNLEDVEEKLKPYIKNCIIDTHTPDCVNDDDVDFVFVLRAPLKLIRKRLEERGYLEEKIRDNLECEIFDEVMCTCEEIFYAHKLFAIGDEENEVEVEVLEEKVLGIIRSKGCKKE